MMHDMTSAMLGKTIYDFLPPEQLNRIPVVTINKNIVFIPAIAQENIDLYYILTGKVEVVSYSYHGRSFLVDTLEANEFVGKFSQMRKQNFYSEIKTRTPCTLLKLTDIKNEVLNDEQFLLFFYFKTSNRLYEMYKASMMRALFTYEEVLAYYLLAIANEAGFIGDKDTHICLKTNISERQYYYLMKKFRNGQMISQDKKGIYLRDIASLQTIASNVTKFMTNRM